jgi:hypothetical protein
MRLVLSEKTSTLYFQEDFHILYTFIKLFTLKTGITKYKNIPGGFQKYNTWFEQFNNTQYCIGNMFWFLRRDLARRPLNYKHISENNRPKKHYTESAIYKSVYHLLWKLKSVTSWKITLYRFQKLFYNSIEISCACYKIMSGVHLNLFSKLALKTRLWTHHSVQSKNTNNAKSEVRFRQVRPDL